MVDIKGSTIVVTAETIDVVLGCDSVDNQLYDDWFSAAGVTKEKVIKKVLHHSSHQLLSSKLNPICRLFHKLCIFSILPSDGTLERVSDIDLMVIYHLLIGKTFSLFLLDS